MKYIVKHHFDTFIIKFRNVEVFINEIYFFFKSFSKFCPLSLSVLRGQRAGSAAGRGLFG